MADLDFFQTEDETFTVSFGDSPHKITGNRVLVNRFEIVFLTASRRYLLGENVVVNDFAGDADKYINRPQALNDLQGIATSVATAIDKTVQSIQSNQPDLTPDTEKLDRAELISIDVVEGIVYASIRIYPVEVEFYNDLVFNFPIRSA